MMSKHFQKFLIKNTIATIIILLPGTYLFATSLSEYFHFFYIILLILTFSVNLLVFYSATSKMNGKDNTMILIVKSFSIKFFSYLILALGFLLFVKSSELKITYVILLFILYIIYTAIEITSLLRFFKTGKE